MDRKRNLIPGCLYSHRWWTARLPLIITILAALVLFAPPASNVQGKPSLPAPTINTPLYLPLILNRPSPGYVVIGWNNLGMHCYDLKYEDMAVLPPYNTIWAQVVLRGDGGLRWNLG